MSPFKPEAIDLSNHLSDVSKARALSPLKGLQKYLDKPGLLMLAGGLPSPTYFPFHDVSANVLVHNSFPVQSSDESSTFSWFWKLLGAGTKEKTVSITVPKYPTRPEDINLAKYGLASGLPQLQKFVQEFSAKVYKPGYKNYTTLLHAGNTDAWSKVVLTLCNPGEGVFVSKWTYPSAMAAITPYNIKPVPVDNDAQGMRADALRTILIEWDESARGMPRSNLSGLKTTSLARKKEIYEICVEDDPYFILQEGEYVPKAQRAQRPSVSYDDDEKFIASLEPSYLKIDYQGRVIRLDTFSKTIAPGCRLGWYTCNPLFAERLERAAETSTQAPCGFSQALVTSTLLEWGYAGYIRWLKALRLQYTIRRDFMVDCMAEDFHLTVAPGTEGIWEGCQVYSAFTKPNRSVTGYFNEKTPPSSNALFDFVPPTAGMFIWLKVHFDQHPSFVTLGVKELENKLWIELAEAGLLLAPGVMFKPTDDWSTVKSGHYRISFSNGENAEFKKATKIFGTVLRKFMGTS
ncbi:pyridoxal phosphate-dependent transferase [Mycena pura]|uniref:Pyridoxal phosphate-dependent transferase n=1 Tax=Mycena pura TaxID=153505 RepID=A0AAD6YTE0_9AGAR|nr:pyridoxal phosphate-dependent transferase [Mycena pura]